MIAQALSRVDQAFDVRSVGALGVALGLPVSKVQERVDSSQEWEMIESMIAVAEATMASSSAQFPASSPPPALVASTE